ncbi:MAG: hypothetical protein K6B40_03585 [Firmicutes bacterium]|nr:hypothetical protein [Bacillota bacterium]
MNDPSQRPPAFSGEAAFPELWAPAPYCPPETEQWLRLYQAAEKAAHCQAGRLLKSAGPLLVRLPQRSEPVFVSLLRQKETTPGWNLAIYPGYQSYAGSPSFNGGDRESPLVSLGRFNGFLCRFPGRKPSIPAAGESPPSETEEQRQGRFLCCRAGQTPRPLSAPQAELTIQILTALPPALLALSQGKLVLAKEQDQLAECFYREEEQVWDCRAAAAPLIPLEAKTISIVDELFIARLKKNKITAAVLELDVLYLPLPCLNPAGQGAVYPLACLLADRDGLRIEEQHLFSKDEDVHAVIVAMLGQYILEKGRPRKLHVRNQSFKYLLADLCQKLSVGLEAEQGMPAVDGFVESIAGYLARGSR